MKHSARITVSAVAMAATLALSISAIAATETPSTSQTENPANLAPDDGATTQVITNHKHAAEKTGVTATQSGPSANPPSKEGKVPANRHNHQRDMK